MMSEAKGRGGYKSFYLKVNQIKCNGIQINTSTALDSLLYWSFFQGCLNEILSTTSINFVKGGLLICIIKSAVLKFTL